VNTALPAAAAAPEAAPDELELEELELDELEPAELELELVELVKPDDEVVLDGALRPGVAETDEPELAPWAVTGGGVPTGGAAPERCELSHDWKAWGVTTTALARISEWPAPQSSVHSTG
jgi:hypothetical protein